MLDYISVRYGTPVGAWAHEMSAGWYDLGGIVPPGLSHLVNMTGHDEYVVNQALPLPAGVGTTVHVEVHGNVVGSNGMAELAETIKRVFQTQARSGTRIGVS